MKTISIIVPIFNEEKTILEVLTRLTKLKISGWNNEIIVVDDGSKDNSNVKILASCLAARRARRSGQNSKLQLKRQNLKILRHKKNLGKGAAIQTALKYAAGDYMIVQDSDLEYNPKEIGKLVKKMEETNSKLVLGSRDRVLRGKNYLFHTFGINLTTYLVNLLYKSNFSDVYTCYKLFNLELIKKANVRSNGFEWDLEALVKLLKKGYKHTEVEISYNPRNFSEGKKIKPWHGIIGLWAVIKNRIM